MRSVACLAFVLVCLGASRAPAFVILNPSTRWPSGEFSMDVSISHPALGATSPSGVSWNSAFAEAAGKWNSGAGGLLALTTNTGVLEAPCDRGDGVHGVGFTADICGTAFGSSTLAVALRSFAFGGLVTEANIVFKQTATWDVYAGPLQFVARDFRRVAVHEIGHLFGLGHETGLPSIMEPFTSALEDPQVDDLNGIDAIYDLTCPTISSAGAGSRAGSLGVSDCFGSEVGLALPALVGAAPEANSFVDLFRVTLTSATTLGVTLSSPSAEFNPVIQVMDTALANEQASGWAPRDSPASVSKPLAAGSYVVVVRSIFEGAGGSYTLQLVPEPGGAWLAASALAALAALQRLRRRSG